MFDLSANKISLAAARCRRLFWAAMSFSVFTNLLMLTGPLFMLQVYDRVLGSRSEETLVAMFGLVALLFFIYGLLEFARGRVTARIGARVQSAFGSGVFNAILKTTALRAIPRGQQTGLQDLEAIRTFFTSPLLLAIFDLPWTPVFLCAIFIFHPLLGWLALGGGGLLIFIALANQILTFRKTARAQTVSHAATAFSSQVQTMSELAWAQGMSGALETRWRKLQDEAQEYTIGANDWIGFFTSFTKAFRLFLQSAMLGLGAWLVLQNELTPGAMIAASILLGRVLAPIEQGLPQWPLAQRARRGWNNLKTLLGAIQKGDEPTRLPPPMASMNVRDVSIVLPSVEKPVLRGITFFVAPGEALGIIGKSGSGKSTLARVLMGLIAPTAGEVRLGGATLKQYGSERLGKLIGYLPQDIQFFDGTIAENIAHMSLEPDSAQVVDAAQKARVHDVILQLPSGYDTRIGPADAQLSGGQKQRLALARALYGHPTVLVLDEPSSALDAEGSEALNAAVAEMKTEEKSVIIMTHRPQAIAQCDRLLILEGGRSSAFGPRDEIIQTMIKNADNVHQALKAGGV